MVSRRFGESLSEFSNTTWKTEGLFKSQFIYLHLSHIKQGTVALTGSYGTGLFLTEKALHGDLISGVLQLFLYPLRSN